MIFPSLPMLTFCSVLVMVFCPSSNSFCKCSLAPLPSSLIILLEKFLKSPFACLKVNPKYSLNSGSASMATSPVASFNRPKNLFFNSFLRATSLGVNPDLFLLANCFLRSISSWIFLIANSSSAFLARSSATLVFSSKSFSFWVNSSYFAFTSAGISPFGSLFL